MAVAGVTILESHRAQVRTRLGYALERGAKPEPVPIARDGRSREGPKDAAEMERRNADRLSDRFEAQRFCEAPRQERANGIDGLPVPGSRGRVPGRTLLGTASRRRNVVDQGESGLLHSEEVRLLSGEPEKEEALKKVGFRGAQARRKPERRVRKVHHPGVVARQRLHEDVGPNGDRAAVVADATGVAGAVRLVPVEEDDGSRLDHRAIASLMNLEDALMRESDHVRRLALLGSETGSAREASVPCDLNGRADVEPIDGDIEVGRRRNASPCARPVSPHAPDTGRGACGFTASRTGRVVPDFYRAAAGTAA